MNKGDPFIRYQHMLENAHKAQTLARGLERSDLNKNWVNTYALVRALEVIGEAADHLPSEEQQRHPEIPWAQIVGLRNRLIHGYDSVDLDILWQIVNVDIPPLISALEIILAKKE